MRPSRAFGVAFMVAALTCLGPAALAAWNHTSDGQGRAEATSMPSGNTPWTSVSNRDVTVSWSAVTIPSGAPVDGYKVFRYNEAGTAFPVSGSCAGLVAGATCTDTAVTPGSWHYQVAPVYKLWQGAEGPASAAAPVSAPELSLTGSTNITSFPGTLNGTVSNYIPGQTLTMRLDDPTTGQVLTATVTPNSIPAGGTASFQVTVPNTVIDGNHTLFAVGSAGDQAGGGFTVAVPLFTPTSLALINGSTQAGRMQENDSIQVAYSQPLAVASLCGGATDDAQPLTMPGVVQLVDDAGTSGHDLLTINAPTCTGGLRFGSISLGSSDFTTSTHHFDAVITYTPANRTITIVLGARNSGGPQPSKVDASVTASYTPDPAMKDTTGRLISGTASSTGLQF
jgi:hypothetical protein